MKPRLKMFDQLSSYKEQLEDIVGILESRNPISDEAQERLDDRISLLQECVELFYELIDKLSEYNEEYKGLGRL